MQGQLRLVEGDDMTRTAPAATGAAPGAVPEAPAVRGNRGPGPSGGPRTGRATWEIDDHTREVGRHGLAMARQALRRAESRSAA